MSTAPKRAGRIRRFSAFLLDLGIAASIGFIIMWPLGAFEGQEAFVRNQIILRIIGLFIGGYLIAHGWLWFKHRLTLGNRIMAIGNGTTIADKPLAWWKAILRCILVVVAAIAPLATLILNLMWARLFG